MEGFQTIRQVIQIMLEPFLASVVGDVSIKGGKLASCDPNVFELEPDSEFIGAMETSITA